MRLYASLSLCLAAAALPPVPAHADPGPGCALGSREFPLATRIHGGPGSYAAGGGYGTWYLDLTNTTDRTCTAVHPVVVLVDDKRTLKATQSRLEFYDGPRARPVRFETTDENELVGPFDDGFPGFTVPPGRTVTVKVRLALASDTAPDHVTANAAVVQRHTDDGDWVGQSNDYRFGIDAATDATSPMTPTAPEPAYPNPRSSPPGTPPSADETDELASTGLVSVLGALAALALLLAAVGTTLVRGRRRQ